ncbi:MAG: XRE family transcriptional regulator [Phycisphaerales bacterium]
MNTKDLGIILKKLRTEKGIGLRQLSRQADISPASLIAIEKGTSSPTLATLGKILNELGYDLADFFVLSKKKTDTPVSLQSGMQSLSDKNRIYKYLLAKTAKRRFILVHETIAPTEKQSEWEQHVYDLAGTILSGGSAELEIENEGKWKIKAGDAFYIHAHQKHRLVNLSKTPLKLIIVSENKRP